MIKNFTKLMLTAILLVAGVGGVNSVKAESKFIKLGSVLTLDEAVTASTNGTGFAIVYNNAKLFTNATSGTPNMSFVDISDAVRGYMFKLTARPEVDEVQYYRIQCYNPNNTLIAAGEAAGAYGNNILSPVSWGSIWSSTIDEEKNSEVWDGREDFQYGAQWCFESDGAGGYYIKTRANGSEKPYVSSSGNMTNAEGKASFKFYSLVEIVPYTLEWTPNSSTYRATIPLSDSYICTTGDVSINYETGEVTNTGSGTLVIYLNNEDLVGATGYNLITEAGTGEEGKLGSILDITDAVNGEVGGIYSSRNSWYIAGDASRKDKIGSVTAFKYNFSGGTGSQTITSIYFDSDLLVAGTTNRNLADMPYGRWGAPANVISQYIDVDSYKTNNIGGGAHDMIYGHDGIGDAHKYVDLTNCSKMTLTGLSSNGRIRLFYNWDGTEGGKPTETLDNFPKDASGTYVFDIDAFKKSKGISFFHLNGIKTEYGQTATISAIKVDEYSNVISGSGIDRTKNYLSNPYLTSIDATGLTNSSAIELTSENPNCLFIANSGKLSNDNNVIVSDACAQLALTDGNPFKAPSDFTATAAPTYNRAFTASTMTTVCLPFDLTETEAATLGTFYQLSTFDGVDLHFTSVAAPLANTPYLVIPANAGITLSETGKSIAATPASLGASITNVEFIGTLAATAIPASDGTNSYFAFDNGSLVKITSQAATLPAFRGYFKVTTSAINGNNARRLGVSFGNDATGISDATRLKDKGQMKNDIFDLQGRRVKTFKKGLYIVNGKKVIK